jgi:multidrug efflux pump subunit AcrB
MLAYGALIAATIGMFVITPSGFIPAQDQGYFLAVIQLPSGASLERTDAVTREVAARSCPSRVRGAVMFAGFHGPSRTSAPHSAAIYFPFKTFDERKLGVTYEGIMDQAQRPWPVMTRRASSCSAPGHSGHRRGRRLSLHASGPRRAWL